MPWRRCLYWSSLGSLLDAMLRLQVRHDLQAPVRGAAETPAAAVTRRTAPRYDHLGGWDIPSSLPATGYVTRRQKDAQASGKKLARSGWVGSTYHFSYAASPARKPVGGRRMCCVGRSAANEKARQGEELHQLELCHCPKAPSWCCAFCYVTQGAQHLG